MTIKYLWYSFICHLHPHLMHFAPIYTQRLILRQWQETDYSPYIIMNSHKEVMRYFPAL